MIIGLVALYKPKVEEMANINSYIGKLDYCFLLDDSGESNEEVVQSILDEYPNKVEYVCNARNVGLCASVNNGYQLAKEKGADWILIMNPDGAFQNDALGIYRQFIESVETDDIAIIAPRFNIDRRPRTAGVGSQEIRYADMTGCLYNVEIFEKIGFYDLNTYFYGLDTEMCLRVKKNQYRIVECSEVVLNHQPAQTYDVKVFGKTVFRCGKDSPQRFYYQFRSAYYIHQNYHDMMNVLFHVYKLAKVIFLFDHKSAYFRSIKMGISDARKGYFGNINDRVTEVKMNNEE